MSGVGVQVRTGDVSRPVLRWLGEPSAPFDPSSMAGPGQGEQWTTDALEPLPATLPVHSAIPAGEEECKCRHAIESPLRGAATWRSQEKGGGVW